MGNFKDLRVWSSAKELGYISNDGFKELELKCNNIGGMLTNLIKARRDLVRK